jgi:hypothetical protein
MTQYLYDKSQGHPQHAINTRITRLQSRPHAIYDGHDMFDMQADENMINLKI